MIATLIDSLASDAEALKQTDPHHIATMSPGDTWWQGDVGVHYIGVDKPTITWPLTAGSSWIVGVGERIQLADGTGDGARHEAVGMQSVVRVAGHPLVGWLIHAPDGFTVEHPVHGDVTFAEPGWYWVRFQRAHQQTGPKAARRVVRAAD